MLFLLGEVSGGFTAVLLNEFAYCPEALLCVRWNLFSQRTALADN